MTGAAGDKLSSDTNQNIAAEQPEAVRQVSELAAFRRMLLVSEGTFSLSFSVYNVRRLRDELIEQLQGEYAGIAVIHLPLNVADVLTAVDHQLDSDTPQAIFVLDLEESLPSESESYPVLRALNASREQWERFSCPIVFWLAEHAAALLATRAVDFWRYRSHSFEFVAPSLEIGQWQAERSIDYEMIAGLPVEEKQFRRAELEQRIGQAGSSPSSKMLPHVLSWMFELAELHQVFGDFGDAESMQRSALRMSEQEYGADARQVATALNSLSLLLEDTNRLAEAEALARRALAIDEQVYGVEHPSIAIDLGILASMLEDTNRLAEAELLTRRALSINEQAYDAEHPSVATSLNNLAQLLQSTNRLAEAEPLMRRALFINEQAYGADHPSVAINLNNLASLLQDTNRLAEAEPLMRCALSIDEQAYGAEHPAVATCLNNLALLYQDTNRLAEAEPLTRRALAIDEQAYGVDHTSVAIDLNNLAQLLQSMNRLTEAEGVMRRCLEITSSFRDASGYDHPRSSQRIENYRQLLQAMNVPEGEIAKRLQ